MNLHESNNPYATAHYGATFAADAAAEERATFIRRTYMHLAAAVGVFVLIQAAAFALVDPATRLQTVAFAFSGWNWLLILGGFMLVSFVANKWALSSTSLPMQYLGLTLYVVAEAAMFLPLLFYADQYAKSAIGSAAILTGVIFGGLTLTVFITKADFSFLRMFLVLASLGAFGFMICAAVFGGGGGMMGVVLSAVMIVVASGYILYETSNVIHHYRTTQYVAASLALFASVALLFWYILRLLLAFSSD